MGLLCLFLLMAGHPALKIVQEYTLPMGLRMNFWILVSSSLWVAICVNRV